MNTITAMRGVLRRIVTFLLCFLTLYGVALGQREDPPLESPKSPITCEEAYTFINDALLLYSRRSNKKSLFIMVFRAGAAESPRTLNLRRLTRTKEYVVRLQPKVNAVFAQGESTPGFGVIEIYVEGSLVYTLPLAKNANIDLSSCVAA